MKKISILIAAFFMFFATASMAQRKWSPEEMTKMKEQRKKTLVDSLGLSDAIADSVVSIESSYRTKMMDMRKAGSGGGDMMTKMKGVQDEKNAEVKKVLTDDQYTNYIAFEESQRKNMRNRMGAGRRPKDN